MRDRRPSRLSLVTLLTAAATGCGGDPDGPKGRSERDAATGLELVDPGSGPVDCNADRNFTLESVNDFELGTDGWFSYNDHTPGSFQDPPDSIYPIPTQELAPPRCTSRYAIHVRAGGLADWGGGVGMKLVDRPKDASNFDGVSFWARKGPTSFGALRLNVADVFTHEDGGYCDAKAPDTSPNRCGDAFGSYVNLSQDWQLFTLDFSEMRQGGWGKHAPFFDTTHLFALSFQYQAGNWDIYVDDVSFFVRKGGTKGLK
jgi:hypothetical protein